MTAPTTSATPKIALDQRAPSRHDNAVRGTTSYKASAIGQTMIEQSNHGRVRQLVQALVFWLTRDL
jgi:hypothetical protein